MKYTSTSALCLTIIMMLLIIALSVIHTSNDLNSHSIEISPSIEIKMQWPHIAAIVLFTICIFFTTHLHWCFIPFIIFVSGQLIYSTWLLLDKESYIKNQLELSWEIAYAEDLSILKQLQTQWQCQGFYSVDDRPIVTKDIFMHSSCYPILSDIFGSTIYLWGIKLWLFKLIQWVALGLFYIMYIRHDSNKSSRDQEKGPIVLPEEAIIECIPINNEKEYLFHK